MLYELNNTIQAKIDKKWINSLVKVINKTLGVSVKQKNISIALVSDRVIRVLNKNYRHKDKVTDVLSFVETEDKNLKSESKDLGEVLICWPQTKRQAKKYKVTVRQEFSRLLLHGILHLLGYDHEKSVKEAVKMERLEEKILSSLNLK